MELATDIWLDCMHLALNGWAAVREPAGPERYHLQEVAARLGALPDIKVTLIVPEPVPSFSDPETWHVAAAPAGDWGRLQFEQRLLPRSAADLGADLILQLAPSAPIRSPLPNLVRATERSSTPAGLAGRLRRSVGLAGASGASGRFRWQDDPAPRLSKSAVELPPFVGAAYRPTDPGGDMQMRQSLGLPAAYVLAHGLPQREHRRLLAAWTWIEASIGDQIPLVVIGWDADELRSLAFAMDLGESVQALSAPTAEALPAAYRGASAFFYPHPSPSGPEIRWALACGAPVAAASSAATAALVGDAGYLAPADDSRALGAACLSLLVEEKALAERLRQRGLVRASSYHGTEPVQRLVDLAAATVDSTSRGVS